MGSPRASSRSRESMTCRCRCGCVLLPELPQRATGCPHRNRISRSDSDRSGAQVRQQHVLASCQFQDQVVAHHRADAAPEPGTLRQEVRQPREWGASGDKVGLTIVNSDNPTVRRRQDRPAKSDEPVHRLDRQQGPPVSLRFGPSARIDRHEVDRVGLSAEVRAVAGNSPRRCVGGQPASRKRQPQHDGRPRRIRAVLGRCPQRLPQPRHLGRSPIAHLPMMRSASRIKRRRRVKPQANYDTVRSHLMRDVGVSVDARQLS